ncbi:MAG: NADH-quinone oxidoreductase subunit J [Gammaproteobacteria bacterium]|nr:NADH-quinone oxidoreductase subunit J [Gammaproteobacteria bacterium]
MSLLFYTAGGIAVAATALAVSRPHPIRALLYLIVSLLAAAGVMLALGAPFAAALEVMVYAGAIMVLFVFVVMLLNLAPGADARERGWLAPANWIGPAGLSGLLLLELVHAFGGGSAAAGGAEVSAKQVGIALFGPYLLGVELGSMLLLAGLVAAYHLGHRHTIRLEARDIARAHAHHVEVKEHPR